jgi:hypothetical protein
MRDEYAIETFSFEPLLKQAKACAMVHSGSLAFDS